MRDAAKMNPSSNDETILQLREAERERLFKLPDFPLERPEEENGVLLSDRIKYYCKTYKLIDEFNDDLLRPAGYDLTVGRNYSILGERKALNDGMKLEIGPYQVAIIETYETINMPKFLVGRWNVRVSRAYEGLLWVGGAQVDPGFRGHLCCPIYNLSTKPVTLAFRDKLAMIDFVSTTPYRTGECLGFDWAARKMLVFPEYPLLSSGIEAEVKEFEHAIEEAKRETGRELTIISRQTDGSLSNVQTRIDNYVALIFTVVAVLFAGLGIIATKGSDQPSFLSSPVWVAAVALWFALRAYIDRSGREASQSAGWRQWLNSGILAATITGIVLATSLFLSVYSAHVSALEVQRVTSDLAKERRDRDTAIQQLRQQSDGLQQQINQLRIRPTGTR